MNNKLAYPVNYVYITQGYTANHKAIDLARCNTTNDILILSCYDGIITNIFEDDQWGGGLSMTIKYDNGYSSDFKHLAKTLKKIGDRVKKFEDVAIMGNSGWASKGVHLHFNLYKNGIRVNPLENVYLHKGQMVSPKDKDKVLVIEDEPIENEFNIGDKVIINGPLYKSSNALKKSGYVTNKKTVITRKVKARHPYNTTGDLGWMDKTSIKLDTDYVIYTVVKGDTLSGIAKKYNTTWQKIYEDNRDVIGDNPNLIKPGQQLVIKKP